MDQNMLLPECHFEKKTSFYFHYYLNYFKLIRIQKQMKVD